VIGWLWGALRRDAESEEENVAKGIHGGGKEKGMGETRYEGALMGWGRRLNSSDLGYPIP
jgi:hypothetical protein